MGIVGPRIELHIALSRALIYLVSTVLKRGNNRRQKKDAVRASAYCDRAKCQLRSTMTDVGQRKPRPIFQSGGSGTELAAKR